MRQERRDPRFIELDRLISLGQGSVKRDGRPYETIECVSCGAKFTRRAQDIEPDEAQYCRRCQGCLNSEANLALGGRPRTENYEPPWVRRLIYLTEKAAASR
jgi:hypothetical protein